MSHYSQGSHVTKSKKQTALHLWCMSAKYITQRLNVWHYDSICGHEEKRINNSILMNTRKDEGSMFSDNLL